MKKTITIMGILILVLGYILFVTISQKKKIKDELDISKIKVHLVIKKKNIEVPKPYPVYQSAGKEIQYLPDTTKNKYDKLKLEYDHLVLLHNNQSNSTVHDTLRIANSFLLQYPEASKLISFDLSKSKLILQLLRIDGIPVEDYYDLNLDNYNYRYSNGNMSNKRFGQFHLYPDLSYSFRPLNNLHDVDFDLNVKTTNFIYKLGANAFYYPNWDKAGYDMKLTVQYNF